MFWTDCRGVGKDGGWSFWSGFGGFFDKVVGDSIGGFCEYFVIRYRGIGVFFGF